MVSGSSMRYPQHQTIFRAAVLYARVLSKDQERKGFSIPAQFDLLRFEPGPIEHRLGRRLRRDVLGAVNPAELGGNGHVRNHGSHGEPALHTSAGSGAGGST